MFATMGGVITALITEEARAAAPQQIWSTRPVFAECRLQHDSLSSAASEMQPTEGYIRLKQNYGGPVLLSGYSKYLPPTEEAFAIRVHELPTDEFHDCSSTGGQDKFNTARDLDLLYPDEQGFTWYEASSSTMTFFGENNILGKSLVIYSEEPAPISGVASPELKATSTGSE